MPDAYVLDAVRTPIGRYGGALAALPTSVPGVTLNRLCGSGLEATIAANRAVAVGEAALTIAGGVESMSRAPWVLLKPAKGFPPGPETLHYGLAAICIGVGQGLAMVLEAA
ncbi:MAG TPA: hypothetical protein VGH43_15050 [Jatrophihabitans sp.]|jgi:acetyl-CoA acetyltransferase